MTSISKWKREFLLWLVFGGCVGTYLPTTRLSAQFVIWLGRFLERYSWPMHLPVIALLSVLCIRPVSRFVRRYKSTFTSRDAPFTVVEGVFSFLIGLGLCTWLNGSLGRFVESVLRVAPEVATVWIVAAVIFITASCIEASRQPQPAALAESGAEGLIDAPIRRDSEDTLGRIPFVADLYKEIKKFPSDEPFVFGLNGAWGSGKTSVLNLLRTRLRTDREIILVEFNPWYFARLEVLTHRFYSAISNAINRSFFYPDLLSAGRRYARILSPVLRRYGIEITAEERDLEEAKGKVEHYILHTGRRVVILIDDIDRAEPEELLFIFKTVRLAATFKKTIFLLAYDESQVTDHLSRLGLKSDYLEKIVQNPVQLPPVDQRVIDRFVLFSDPSHRSQLDLLFDKLQIHQKRREEFDTEIVSFYAAHLKPFFTTLRDAKRFLASVDVRLPAVKDEVHLLDFVLLGVLRVFENDVYQDIWANRRHYLPEWIKPQNRPLK